MTAEDSRAMNGSAIANGADLLAHWWSRPVAQEIDSWISWREIAATLAEAHGAASAVAVLCSPALAGDVENLLAEYERLFVGPGRVPCPPYESYWRDDVPVHLRRSLMGPCTEDLRRIYADMGLRIAAGTGEMPDQVAVELEGLSVALGSSGMLDAAKQLYKGHIAVWLPKLCRAVAHESAHPFYTELAALTPAWLARVASLTTNNAPE